MAAASPTPMKRVVISLSVLAFAAVIAAAKADPLVIYNPSESVPSGFYLRDASPPQPGAFVTVAAHAVAPEYAALRHYADPTDRFLKRITAVAGQRLCADGADVSVDGALVARRIERDAEGRTLPTWSGCRLLAADEVFLLGDTPDSFDGRYWGPTPLTQIEAVWRPF